MNKQKAFAVALASMVLAMAAAQESVIQAGTRFQVLALPLVSSPAAALTPPIDQQALYFRKAKAETVGQWLELAKQHLAHEPLDATSLLVVSIAAERSDPEGAARALGHAERVSRRSGVAQLEQLRIAATAGDIKAALGHLDRLLTVNEPAVGVVASFVVQLMADPTAVTLLAQYGERHWFPPLLVAAINQDAKPQLVADMLEQSVAKSEALHVDLIPALVRNLAYGGDIRRARAIAQRYGGLTEAGIHDFGISPDTTDPNAGPVNWTVIRSDDGWGTVLGGRKLSFRVEADSTATVLERYTGLAPGRYVLRYDVEVADDGGELAWDLTCRGNRPQTVQLGATSSPDPASRTRQQDFVIGPDCDAQHWRLQASSLAGSGAKEMTISRLGLVSR